MAVYVFTYEAYDERVNEKTDNNCIYHGPSRSECIEEIKAFIECHNQIDEEDITEEAINELDRKSLKEIGILFYETKWT